MQINQVVVLLIHPIGMRIFDDHRNVVGSIKHELAFFNHAVRAHGITMIGGCHHKSAVINLIVFQERK